MAGGLDTGLQVVHYLSRRLSDASPDFVAGRGVLFGELPPNSLILVVNVLVTTIWTGANLILSKNADLSSPAFSLGALNTLGFQSLNPVTQPDAYLVSGKLYLGSNGGTTGGGSAIAFLRFLPRA